MRYILFWLTFMLIMLAAPFCNADEFLDRVAKLEAKAGRQHCTCTSILDCECVPGTCACPACLVKAKLTVLPAAPKANFLHDCGCPNSAPCNCGRECHCAENRAENRQPLRWRHEGGKVGCEWSLWRGNRQIGGIDLGGDYRPLIGDTWGPPCKLPLPLPQKTVAVPVFSGRSC